VQVVAAHARAEHIRLAEAVAAQKIAEAVH